VAWGNTVRLCARAAEALDRVGVESEIIDLRSISPWDQQLVLSSAERTARLLVVHEDNHTCGFGAEVLATVAEKARMPVAMRRVTRPDTILPCNFANQLELLPSFQRVLGAAAELLNLDLEWVDETVTEDSRYCTVEAVGSGPSDETVTISELYVTPEQVVERGAPLAALEATKSVFDLSAPAAGCVEEILVEPGETVPVGSPHDANSRRGFRRAPQAHRPGTTPKTNTHPPGQHHHDSPPPPRDDSSSVRCRDVARGNGDRKSRRDQPGTAGGWLEHDGGRYRPPDGDRRASLGHESGNGHQLGHQGLLAGPGSGTPAGR
jgi:hypothetical protein